MFLYFYYKKEMKIRIEQSQLMNGTTEKRFSKPISQCFLGNGMLLTFDEMYKKVPDY
jgi:hypothetical protein